MEALKLPNISVEKVVCDGIDWLLNCFVGLRSGLYYPILSLI